MLKKPAIKGIGKGRPVVVPVDKGQERVVAGDGQKVGDHGHRFGDHHRRKQQGEEKVPSREAHPRKGVGGQRRDDQDADQGDGGEADAVPHVFVELGSLPGLPIVAADELREKVGQLAAGGAAIAEILWDGTARILPLCAIRSCFSRTSVGKLAAIDIFRAGSAGSPVQAGVGWIGFWRGKGDAESPASVHLATTVGNPLPIFCQSPIRLVDRNYADWLCFVVNQAELPLGGLLFLLNLDIVAVGVQLLLSGPYLWSHCKVGDCALFVIFGQVHVGAREASGTGQQSAGVGFANGHDRGAEHPQER